MTLAIMALLKRSGLPIAPFKAGPDYLDPAWHQQVCGRVSYNLDTFMADPHACRALFREKCGHDLAIVEGVMGLFDGKSGVGGPGSTADLARELNIPVLLVVNARGMAGSVVPLVEGFVRAARGFSIVGILANQVGGASHAELLATMLRDYQLPPLVGWLARNEGIALEERHLGLTLPEEQKIPDWDRLADALHLEMKIFSPPAPSTTVNVQQSEPLPPLLAGKTIAIARDSAFCFIYAINIECLQAMGANIVFFSPLAGEPLPRACTAVWLPGGYPELHARQLSRSPTWETLRTFAQEGGPVLAECGGMMVLGESLADHDGEVWPQAGILPFHTRMTPKLAGLGYRAEKNGVRGHEFHHSKRDPCILPAAFDLDRGDMGLRWKGVRASYVHWYFPSAPQVIARWFMQG